MLRKLQLNDCISLTAEYEAMLIGHSDIPDIILMLKDPRVQEFLFFCPSPDEVYEGYFTPLVDCAAAFRAQAADSPESTGVVGPVPESIVLVVREKKTGEFAGNCGVMTPMAMFCPGNVDVGYQFNASAWGKGLATACTRLLLYLAFEELGAHKVSADLYSRNVGSARVLEKAGFVQEGQLTDFYKLKEIDGELGSPGQFDDKILFGVTLRQYRALSLSLRYTEVSFEGC